jgi:hypothetical protein
MGVFLDPKKRTRHHALKAHHVSSSEEEEAALGPKVFVNWDAQLGQ